MTRLETGTLVDWTPGVPHVHCTGEVCRVSCRIDGEDLWYEADRIEMVPSMEAFAGVLLIPAMQANARLVLPVAVDEKWLAGQKALYEIYRRWWFPVCSEFPINTSAMKNIPASGKIVATCFTGGVDSFHTLLHRGNDVDALYFVHGFDIPLHDQARMEAHYRALEQVAAAIGKKVMLLRSNFREHHVLGKSDWRKNHGAAIVAGSHLCSGMLQRLIIPSSYHKFIDVPWGSHWRTDPLHSSHLVEIEHFGHAYYRHQKVEEVAGNPLFLKHARVCWENLSAVGNCSRCEKCLRTMAALEVLGILGKAEAFDRTNLIGKIDALPGFKPEGLARPWSHIYVQSTSRELRGAILRLLERSTSRACLQLPSVYADPGMHVKRWRSAMRAMAKGSV